MNEVINTHDSSWIDKAEYDWNTGQLSVWIGSKVYIYNAGANLFLGFKNAESRGQFLNQKIKPYVSVSQEEALDFAADLW